MKTYNINKAQDIDWSHPMWVVSKNNPDQFILTTGTHRQDIFEGTCMPCEVYRNGNFSDEWVKSFFVPITGTIMFPISNEED